LTLQTKGSPLVRSVKTDDQKIDETYGFYFDSLVQFTATDSLASKSDEDKLIVWLREQGGETNLVVTAGYLKGDYSAERKDYVVSNVAVESDKWYRLTIEAKTDIFENNNSASFVVYVDGERAKYSADEAAFDSGTWTVKEKYSYLYTDNCHAVFPSMVQSGDAIARIASVAFEGVGRIDDIEFTTLAPDFITAAPASLTVTWTNGVDTLTITPRPEGDPIEIAANGAPGSTNLEAGVYTVTATVQSGYVAAGLPDGEVDASSSVVIVNVTTSPEQATVNGKAYGSLKDAFNAAAAGGGTVRLTLDQEIAAADGIAIAGENGFVLDLAGKNIVVTPGPNADGAINIGVPLTLIDSVGGGAITNTADVTTLFVKGGELVIGRADGDEGATVYGSIAPDNEETISIVKGIFSVDPTEYVADGYKAEQKGESLWEVVENYVAKIGDQSYETFEGALTNAVSGDTIVLFANVALSSTVTVDKNLTIDLNGNDIAATDCRAFHVKAGAFALTGSGKVSATASAEVRAMDKPSFGTSSSVVRVGDSANTKVEASFTLGVDAEVASDWCYGVTYFGPNPMTVVLNGTVAVTGKQSAISGVGTSTGSATVTVAGTVSATQDYAIYNPQLGTTTIAGTATVTGGIEVKGGSLVVQDGATITARNVAESHNQNGNGSSTAGYAIAAVYQGGNYAGGVKPTTSIGAASLTGKVVAFAEGSMTEIAEITATSNQIAVPTGYKWVETETAGVYELKEIVYVTVTINEVSNCTITVKNGNDNVATGARFDVDDAVELTVTRVAAEGYKLAAGCLAEETVTMSENRTITAVVEEDKTDDWAVDTKDVEGKNASEAYGITGALAEVDAAKLTVWARANNVEFADASTKINPEAYALNCANTDEAIATAKEAFDIQAITVDSEGNVTVTAPEALKGKFNGTLQLKGSNNLKDWSDTDTTSGYQFFYYELNLK